MNHAAGNPVGALEVHQRIECGNYFPCVEVDFLHQRFARNILDIGQLIDEFDNTRMVGQSIHQYGAARQLERRNPQGQPFINLIDQPIGAASQNPARGRQQKMLQ